MNLIREMSNIAFPLLFSFFICLSAFLRIPTNISPSSSLQTRHQIEKLLDWENSHLYNKLGLRWRLARQRCDSTLMMEYVSFGQELVLFSHI